MREVHVLISPRLFDANPLFVEGLCRNQIHVERLDITTDRYEDAASAHHAFLIEKSDQEGPVTPRPFLCLAFEDSKRGVTAAQQAGMCVAGIANNQIEQERFSNHGAHVVAMSISEVLERFGVRNYYQVQYLPYVIHLKDLAERKAGYPVSLLDTLRGRFVEDGVDLDPHGSRLIPREILGVVPDSLADVYINNVGWPQDSIRTFRLNARDLERDIIRMFGRFYDIKHARGFVTNGGTEGNFTGLWWIRDYLHAISGQSPILLTSEQTHYSVSKAAQQLGIEGRLIATRRTGEIDVEAFGQALDELTEIAPERPIMVNVNIGTTQTGAIDDVPALHAQLKAKVGERGGHFALHLDAALMGAVLPVIKPFGEADYFRDFDVKTIAISGHKFFGSTAICGLCLTTREFLEDCFARRDTHVRYLTGLHDITPSGSRSGFNVLSFHNTLCGLYMHTDQHRLRNIIHQSYRDARYYKKKLARDVGEEQLLCPKHSLTVCFPRPSEAIMTRYHLMPVNMPEQHATDIEYAGACILLNVDRVLIDSFAEDYAQDLLL